MYTVAANYLLSFYQTCLEQGAKPDDLLPLIPGGDKFMTAPEMRVPADAIFKLLAKTEQVTGNPAIGLMAGKNIRPSTFIDAGHAVLFCKSLRQAILLNRHYQPLAQQFGRSNLKIVGDEALLTWHSYNEDPEYSRNITDAVLASHAQFGRWLTWVHDKKINAVRFRHKKPSYARQYEELFECPVYFEQDDDALVVDVETIDMPLPQANDDMLQSVCKRLDAALANLEASTPYQAQVANIIEAALVSHQLPCLENTAIQLGISVRGLRRRLSEEGTSYRIVLENTRRDLCKHYMLSGKLALGDIAGKLGFSEQSAFSRAFKSWFGTTPRAYTRNLKTTDTTFDQFRR